MGNVENNPALKSGESAMQASIAMVKDKCSEKWRYKKMEKTIDERKDVTPEKIFETYFAHMSTAVLVTGVDLEEYTHIKNGHRTAVEIAKAARASPRGMEILLNGLVALNFLTKSSEVYQLTPLAEKFLVKDNPAYLGDWVQTADMNQKIEKFPMSSRLVSPTVLLSRENQGEGG